MEAAGARWQVVASLSRTRHRCRLPEPTRAGTFGYGMGTTNSAGAARLIMTPPPPNRREMVTREDEPADKREDAHPAAAGSHNGKGLGRRVSR